MPGLPKIHYARSKRGDVICCVHSEKAQLSALLFQRELSWWRSFWMKSSAAVSSEQHPLSHDLISTAYENLFPNIYQLILIGCVCPVGSFETERSFSLLRSLKTHLRSTVWASLGRTDHDGDALLGCGDTEHWWRYYKIHQRGTQAPSLQIYPL